MSATWQLTWPEQQVVGVPPILRAIATGDLHNLVFQADYRIIPAVTRPD